MLKRIPIRWIVLALLLGVTVVNFVDRQALSVLAPVLREKFRLSATDYGFIVACFQFGMVVGEFPMGWLADRRGARFALSLAVMWWSMATAMHSLGQRMWHFAALRFCLGTAECANFSGGMKVVAQWFPVRERAFAVGVFNAGSMLGAIIAPPFLVFLTLRYGWQMGFLAPGLLGMFWVIAWRLLYESPERHPRVTEQELAHIHQDRETSQAPVSNRELLSYPEVWGLIFCRLLITPVVQFYWYWTPEYLYRERGMSLRSIGMFSWIPFLFGDIGSVGGGWLSGWLIRRGMPVAGARRVTMYSGGLCCLLSFAVPRLATSQEAIAVICFVLLGHLSLSANFFARISDLTPSNAVSRVTGLTGIASGVSGMLFPLLTGWMVDHVSYSPVFLIASSMPLLGVVGLELLSQRPALKARALGYRE